MNIAILCSTVRHNSSGSKVTRFAKKIAEERNWAVSVIDPAEYKLPLLDETYKEMRIPEDKFVKIHSLLAEADGFILITAEYNHSVPPALKNLLDHFREEYFYKPAAIISYSSGPFGGIRATEHLRHICAELRMTAIPTSLPVSKVDGSLNEDGTSVNGDYERRSKKFLNEFAWYLEAYRTQRQKGLPS